MSGDWQNVLIHANKTVKEALAVIDSQSLRIALVVDEKRKLLGTVTDGDVRRAILSGTLLDDVVVHVMNPKPVKSNVTASKSELFEVMNRLDLLAIPLVDHDGVVVGLQTLHDSLISERRHNPVFIMAGGFGTRLRPLTDRCPKPMLRLGDKPILEVLLRSFISYGFYKFYISTHYLPEVIMDYFGDGSRFGVEIAYVHEETPLGTGGALGLLPENVPDLPLIMINGDILTKVDFDKLLRFHEQHQAIATMCVRNYEYQVPFGVVKSGGVYIESMVEKPVQRFFVNAGIYIVTKQLFSLINKNEYLDMPTLLERHMLNDEKILQFPIHEYWLDVGRIDDFKKAQLDIQTLEF